MVGETTMSQRNGSTAAPPNGVAQDMGELTHDMVSLAELQFELFRTDCRKGLKGLLVPVALLLLAVIVAAGTVPVALICRCRDPRAGRRPIAGGGLFDRRAGRLHRGGGPGSRGVVPHPRSRDAFLSIPAKN